MKRVYQIKLSYNRSGKWLEGKFKHENRLKSCVRINLYPAVCIVVERDDHEKIQRYVKLSNCSRNIIKIEMHSERQPNLLSWTQKGHYHLWILNRIQPAVTNDLNGFSP